MYQLTANSPMFMEVLLQDGSQVVINIHNIKYVQKIEEADYILVYMIDDTDPLYVSGDYEAFKRNVVLKFL